MYNIFFVYSFPLVICILVLLQFIQWLYNYFFIFTLYFLGPKHEDDTINGKA